MEFNNDSIKSACSISKLSMPFYEPPPRKTSAEIINEARVAIRESQMDNTVLSASIKPLQTQRPFTPRDKERLLFGKKLKSNRPPSSFRNDEKINNLKEVCDNPMIQNLFEAQLIKEVRKLSLLWNMPLPLKDRFKTKKSEAMYKIFDFCEDFCKDSLRYLQNETDLPNSNPENNMVLSPAMITTLKNSTATASNRFQQPIKQRSNSISEISDSKIFNIGLKELSVNKVKLPSLESLKPLQKRKIYKNTLSLDNLPEENEASTDQNCIVEARKVFSSPQERTEYNVQKMDSPFGRPSKQQNLSQCLLLGPQNLNKLFDNQHIIEHSEMLFANKGYLNKEKISKITSKLQKSVLVDQKSLKQRTVELVLDDLIAQSSKKNNELIVIDLLNELYECMDNENLLSSKVSSKLKIHVLKCLYKFVESQNDQLLLNIARVILALKVTGNNLNGVCKLVFKVCKIDKNDHLFFQKNILELFLDALGRSSPLDDAEACVYGYGSIKFLTMNPLLLEKILSLGILQLMILHIKIINNAKSDKTTIPQQTNHALFQLTGALRNLASDETVYEMFISCGAITQLCQTMELFWSDIDVVSNIARTFSIISANDCCCDSLIEYKNIYKVYIQLFQKYPGNEEIIIRLTYTLGNIVAKIDNTRVKFYHENKSIESLIVLWKIYLERTLKHYSLKVDQGCETNGNSEDVMIKIIRVIANIVINPDIGKEINENYGNQLIDEFLKVLISNPFKKNDELVLSILSTLNNLSYYYSSDLEHDIFHIKQVDIVEGIIEYTKSSNTECVIESMRILGNLSRSKITRNYITESEIFQTLLNLLDKADLILLKTTIGVLVNLMADNKSRMSFKNNGGMTKLVNILKNYTESDWLLGMLVCQVIWNFCIDTVDLYELLSDHEIQQLLILLADYLDEEKLFGINENSENEKILMTQEYLVWEEFANVATNLLEKIEYFLDTFDQINIDSNSIASNNKDTNTNISFAAW